MTSRVGTGRWSDVTEEVQPFGMSFVDIVASALVCVVALLILFLQFINPLGYIPGHSEPKVGTEVRDGSPVDSQGRPAYAMPGVMLSLLATWPDGTRAGDGQINVHVDCSGEQRFAMIPAVNGFAAMTLKIATLSSNRCFVDAAPEGGSGIVVTLSSRALVDGKRPRAISFNADGVARDVLTGDDRSLKNSMGADPHLPWAFHWSREGG